MKEEQLNKLALSKGVPVADELRGAMGFPRNYVLPTSLVESGRLLGNAVVPQISKFIASQLVARA